MQNRRIVGELNDGSQPIGIHQRMQLPSGELINRNTRLGVRWFPSKRSTTHSVR
jgi:hypothetical protein